MPNKLSKVKNSFAIFSALLSIQSFGLNAEAQKILNKKNRVLKPPPRSILANRYSGEHRYDVGVKRAETVVGINSSLKKKNTPTNQGTPTPYWAESIPNVEGGTIGQNTSYTQIGEEKPLHQSRINLALAGAGIHGNIGAEFSFRLTDYFFGVGLGTGGDYSSWSAHAKYYTKYRKILPFFELGYGQWSLNRSSATKGAFAFPSHLTEKFFSDNGELIPRRRVHIVYPSVGFVYISKKQIAAFASVQYLVNLNDFEGGFTGSLGLMKFF